jgi:hypothetical protein
VYTGALLSLHLQCTQVLCCHLSYSVHRCFAVTSFAVYTGRYFAVTSLTLNLTHLLLHFWREQTVVYCSADVWFWYVCKLISSLGIKLSQFSFSLSVCHSKLCISSQLVYRLAEAFMNIPLILWQFLTNRTAILTSFIPSVMSSAGIFV